MWTLLVLIYAAGGVAAEEMLVANREICVQAREEILAQAPKDVRVTAVCAPRTMYYKYELDGKQKATK